MPLKNLFNPIKTTAACADGTLTHEYDESGMHKLTMNGKEGSFETYGNIAYLLWPEPRNPEKIYAATTEYYFGELPEIFEVLVIKKHDIDGNGI